MLKIGLSIFILFLGVQVHGNNEESIISIHSGAPAYMAVTPGSGTSKKDLGIYIRKNSDWELALPGEISLDPHTGPGLFQFEISKSDKRAQTLFLVDGFLTLVSQNLDFNSKKSFVKIGSIDSPLVHPITKTEIYLPPIQQTSNFHIHESRHSGLSIVYVSVQISGNKGYTFAFTLKPITGIDINIGSNLVLLHDSFLNIDDLQVFAGLERGVHAPSTILGENFLGNVLNNFSEYRELLRPWSENLKKNGFKDFSVMNVDTETVEISQHLIPNFEITSASEIMPLYQVFNLQTSEKFLVDDISDLSQKSLMDRDNIAGTIDLDTENKPLFRMVPLENGRFLEVMSVDGVLRIGSGLKNKRNGSFDLKVYNVKDLSLTYFQTVDSQSKPNVFKVIVSIKKKNDSTSNEIWKVSTDSEDSVTSVSRKAIDFMKDQFYSSKDLSKSIFSGNGTSKGDLFFKQPGTEDGVGMENYVNINETLASDLKVYGKPKFLNSARMFRLMKVDQGHQLQYYDLKQEVVNLPENLIEFEFDVIRQVSEISTDESLLNSPDDGGKYDQEFWGAVSFRPAKGKPKKLLLLYILARHDGGFRSRFYEISQDLGADQIAYLKGRLGSEVLGQGTSSEEKRFFLDISQNIDGTELIDIAGSIVEGKRVDSLLGHENLDLQKKSIILQEQFSSMFPGLKLVINGDNAELKHYIVDNKDSLFQGQLVNFFENRNGEDGFFSKAHQVEVAGQNIEIFFLEALISPNNQRGAVVIFRFKNPITDTYFCRLGSFAFEVGKGAPVLFDPDKILELKVFSNGTISDEERQKSLEEFIDQNIRWIVKKHRKKLQINENDQSLNGLSEDEIFEVHVKNLTDLYWKFKGHKNDSETISAIAQEELSVEDSDITSLSDQFSEVDESLLLQDEYEQIPDLLLGLFEQLKNEEKLNFYNHRIEILMVFENSTTQASSIYQPPASSPSFFQNSHNNKKSGIQGSPHGKVGKRVKKKKRPAGGAENAPRDLFTLAMRFDLEDSLNQRVVDYLSLDHRAKLYGQGQSPEHFMAHLNGRLLWIKQSAQDILAKSLELEDALNKKLIYRPNESRGRNLRNNIVYSVPVEDRPAINIHSRFQFENTWKVSPIDVVARLQRDYEGLDVSPFMGQIFSGIASDLEKFIDQRGRKKMKVLLLPKEIRSLVIAYLTSYYKDEKNSQSSWSSKNNDLRVFIPPFSEEGWETQYSVIDNVEVISQVEPEKNFLFLPLDKLSELSPTNPDEPSVYTELQSVGVDENATKQSGRVISNASGENWPHISFILASQGDGDLSYEQSRELDKRLPFPVLLIGSTEDWDSFKENSGEFLNYDFDNWFDVSEVQTPTLEAKTKLLSSIFLDPSISMLGYKFDSSNIVKNNEEIEMSQSEQMNQVLRYAVNRVESNAKATDSNTFSIYLDFLALFSKTLVNDRSVRSAQIVDKALIENMMSQMFNIPLNRNFLNPDDPMYILSRPDAAVKLQEAGYTGPINLKRQVIGTIVSQLSPSQTKAIPSSIILAGESGTGKTQMFDSLVKMLGLQLYDFEPGALDNNDGAQAIVIKADKLSPDTNESSGGSSNQMTVSQAIGHLEHFLSLPHGFRGFILIDDLYGATETVRATLLVYLRSLFESKDGMYSIEEKVVRFGNRKVLVEQARRPVRGLNIIVTSNFTEDKSKIKRFADKPDSPTVEELIVASFSTAEHTIETSFIRRFGAVIPFSYFPAEAKGPGLLDSFFKRAKSTLELQSRLAFLSPKLVEKVVDNFKGQDARTFLNDATNTLFQLFDQQQESGSFQIIVPNFLNVTEPSLGFDVEMHSLQMESISNQSKIGAYIFQNSQIINIDDDFRGRLHLLRWLVGNYRVHLFEAFLQALEESSRFSGNLEVQQMNFYPMVQAMYDHIHDHQDLPLSSFQLDPVKFGVRQSYEKLEFHKYIQQIDLSLDIESQSDYFPFSFVDSSAFGQAFRELTSMKTASPSERTRTSAVSETVSMIEPYILQDLASFLRISDVNELPSTEEWTSKLKESDPRVNSQIWEELVNSFFYMRRELINNSASQSSMSVNGYHLSRIYFYTLDKVISQLPWEVLVNFFADTITDVSQDMTLNQLPGFEWLLTRSQNSPLKAMTSDLLEAKLTNLPALREASPEPRIQQSDGFRLQCTEIFK